MPQICNRFFKFFTYNNFKRGKFHFILPAAYYKSEIQARILANSVIQATTHLAKIQSFEKPNPEDTVLLKMHPSGRKDKVFWDICADIKQYMPFPDCQLWHGLRRREMTSSNSVPAPFHPEAKWVSWLFFKVSSKVFLKLHCHLLTQNPHSGMVGSDLT